MSSTESKNFDAIVVGAGFAGMYLVHRLRNMGFSVRCIESASDVGGTWYWNRYPGARCDVPSLEYSFKFDEQLQQDWQWPERYSAQPEILEYAKHVADRFDLRKDITFNTQVESAHYDEDGMQWKVATNKGENLTAQFCIMASGALSSTNYPNIKGLKSFKGEMHHTGAWPQDKKVDFSGKRVGIIGTGSSGIQAIPMLAEQAEHLHVFQRTAQYAIPSRNKPMDKKEEREVKANYKAFRDKIYRLPGAVLRPENVKSVTEAGPEETEEILEKAWARGGTGFLRAFSDLMENAEKNAVASDFAKKKMGEIVQDPEILKKLMPDYSIGCKRIVLDTNYFQTYNRDNVTLVDVKDHPIDEITEKGIITNGIEYELDCIIFATGYDAMTGALTRIDIRGRNRATVKETWKDGPQAFMGMAVNGFPNMFTICGPGSPSVLSNVITHIEQNVEWISDCMSHMRDNGKNCIEVTRESEMEWSAHVAELGDASLFAQCNSWYVGANIPGKPRVFLAYAGGFPAYTDKCDDIASNGYAEFNQVS
jgi:cation diffusion facilitator CzcD-associated flavoprotein CzcO